MFTTILFWTRLYEKINSDIILCIEITKSLLCMTEDTCIRQQQQYTCGRYFRLEIRRLKVWELRLVSCEPKLAIRLLSVKDPNARDVAMVLNIGVGETVIQQIPLLILFPFEGQNKKWQSLQSHYYTAALYFKTSSCKAGCDRTCCRPQTKFVAS